MNYRKDSDIVESYGFRVVKKGTKLPLNEYTFKKAPNGFNYNFDKEKRSIFWVVSHCPTDNFREDYVKKLKEYIDVDTYGHCGDKPCPNAHAGHDFCFDDLSLNHSFYLGML